MKARRTWTISRPLPLLREEFAPRCRLGYAAHPVERDGSGDVIRRTHSHLYRRGERPVSKLYANVRRALDRFGVRVGVRIGRPGRPAILWQIRDEFRR
jgi:hypothetical protein